MTRGGSTLLLLLAGGLLTGCGDDPAPVRTAPASRCTNGLRRDPNESEGPEMLPGHTCSACHAESNAASGEGDAPIFAFAGTLFPSSHEPDDCVGSGADGALVTVTGADGTSFSSSVNASGNFFVEAAALDLPFTAKVSFEGRERRMAVAQFDGECNGCHTAEGLNGAPGRILLP